MDFELSEDWTAEVLATENRLHWYARQGWVKPVPVEVLIIEDIVGNEMDIAIVVEKYFTTYEAVYKIIDRYLAKPPLGLCVMSKI